MANSLSHGFGALLLLGLLWLACVSAATTQEVRTYRANQNLSIVGHVTHGLARLVGWSRPPAPIPEFQLEPVEAPRNFTLKDYAVYAVEGLFDWTFAFLSNPLASWTCLVEIVNWLVHDQYATVLTFLACLVAFVWANVVSFFLLRFFAVGNFIWRSTKKFFKLPLFVLIYHVSKAVWDAFTRSEGQRQEKHGAAHVSAVSIVNAMAEQQGTSPVVDTPIPAHQSGPPASHPT